jgi:cyclopropane-fatty-acyl-phospholipid synthase
MILANATRTVERIPLPDAVSRAGIDYMVGRTRRRLRRSSPAEEYEFAIAMTSRPIAEHPATANGQHYELPPEFFGLILGPQRKYSCALYDSASTIAEAEQRALEVTAAHAELADGQRILELGCGWGALSLWMASRFPASTIVAVSNSRTQKSFIEAEAAKRGLTSLCVVTADMNGFDTTERFDRVVSVEMWEHMSNWPALLTRVHRWLDPQGRLFLHVFSHRAIPYRFEDGDKSDWIAQHFFTGGIMPSHGLIRRFPEYFAVDGEWRWGGEHYAQTALAWLANFDANQAKIDPILADVYGRDAPLWRRRWRLFFLATAGLFGHANGEEWGVSHYNLRPL